MSRAHAPVSTLAAVPLPAALAALCRVLPARVRCVRNDTDPRDVWVISYQIKLNGWVSVWYGGDRPRCGELHVLEKLIREECLHRGWRISQSMQPVSGLNTPLCSARIGRHEREADTAAHALLLSFLAALGYSIRD